MTLLAFSIKITLPLRDNFSVDLLLLIIVSGNHNNHLISNIKSHHIDYSLRVHKDSFLEFDL